MPDKILSHDEEMPQFTAREFAAMIDGARRWRAGVGQDHWLLPESKFEEAFPDDCELPRLVVEHLKRNPAKLVYG